MTESMQFCDIVLPAATHFECDDLYAAYGHHWLQRAEAAIPPVGEALPNTEIFRRLAARFGFDDPCFKASDRELMDDAIDGTHPHMHGTRPSEISLREALRMRRDVPLNGLAIRIVLSVVPASEAIKQCPTLPRSRGSRSSSIEAATDRYPRELEDDVPSGSQSRRSDRPPTTSGSPG